MNVYTRSGRGLQVDMHGKITGNLRAANALRVIAKNLEHEDRRKSP